MCAALECLKGVCDRLPGDAVKIVLQLRVKWLGLALYQNAEVR